MGVMWGIYRDPSEGIMRVLYEIFRCMSARFFSRCHFLGVPIKGAIAQ